jgi:hypothetical protein
MVFVEGIHNVNKRDGKDEPPLDSTTSANMMEIGMVVASATRDNKYRG